MKAFAILASAGAAAILAAACTTAAPPKQMIAPPDRAAADHSAMGHSMAMPPMPAVYMGQAEKDGAPVFTGLGDHSHPISTRVPEAQRFFDQGVKLLFGFNHAEAIRSFREAARLDPDCAMCWWGVAFALGPNINLPMGPDAVAPAWAALEKAKALAPRATAREQAWIAALALRYAPDPQADRRLMDAAFAQAMGDLARRYPDDLDAATFHAEAMMDTQPWDYWQADGVTGKGNGPAIVATLEDVLKRKPDHPGALHLYIHAVEASTTPERAEKVADRLLTLMPQAGHIVHMPSHIYYRVGRYEDAARANEQAAKVDEDYIAACRAQGFYPAGYYGHNIHFLWTSSEMAGRRAAALDAARRLGKAVNARELAKMLPQGELYDFPVVVSLLRFGQWDAVLAEPAPPESLRLDTAMWLYAHGFAAANTGDRATALSNRARLAELTKGDFAPYEAFAIPARQMSSIGLALLDGELARTSGDLTGAVAQFRKAAELERALPYMEPPYWHQPVSHLLGAALLEARRPKEAEAVYRESLKHYRRDGWALNGLTLALRAQGRTAEAALAQAEFDKAWAMADVKLASSRF